MLTRWLSSLTLVAYSSKRQEARSVTAFPQSELVRVIAWLNRGGSPDDLGEFLSDAGLTSLVVNQL
ncbi:hypothetical protein NJ56_06265 [Yersinia ruckeri]|nr:hypothetical protein NJ56_06265 [Yersinia ruckeri]